MDENKKVEKTEQESCASISEDHFFWNELQIIVEDGVKASFEEDGDKGTEN